MSANRLLFYTTLMLMLGFTASFGDLVGRVEAVPAVAGLWIAWGLGVAWIRSKGWS
ncbi:MAG: hypothetical protein U0821_01320 [Chloroflexota bacterium]